MPINYPDNVKHNNNAFPIISASDLTVQGWYHVANTTERDAIPAAKRLTGAVVVVGTAVYVYTGGALDDTTWQSSGNWAAVTTGSLSWGSIAGTLSNQTDLQLALDAKANSSHTHVLADVTDSGDLAALNTVGTNEIDNLSVTTDKLASNAVTSSKIGALAIDSTKIADSSVTTSKLGAGAVTNGKIQDAAITGGKLVDGTVTSSKIGTIGDSNLPTYGISYNKLAGDIREWQLQTSYTEKVVKKEEPVEPFMPWSGEVLGTFSNRRTYSPFELDRFLGRGTELLIDLDGTPISASRHQNLTNQSYGQAVEVAAAGGNTGVLTIDMVTNGLVSSNGFTYSQGFLMLTFYSGRGPVSVSCRTLDKNGNWTNRTCTAQMTSSNTVGATEAVYWSVSLSGNYITKIELTMTSQTSQQCGLGNISYLGTRMVMSQGPQINTLGGKFFGEIGGKETGTDTWSISQSGDADFNAVTINGSPLTDGADGADGADGQGVPTGGTAGQILEKVDGTDYNTQWADAPSGGGTNVELLVCGTSSSGSIPSSFNQTMSWDTPSLNTASVTHSGGEFTIPAGLNGTHVEVTVQIGGQNATAPVQLDLNYKRDSGSGYVELMTHYNYVAHSSTQNKGTATMTYLDPTPLSTGDKIKIDHRRVGGALDYNTLACHLSMRFYSV